MSPRPEGPAGDEQTPATPGATGSPGAVEDPGAPAEPLAPVTISARGLADPPPVPLDPPGRGGAAG